CTRPTEICLNGAKRLFSNSPIEKKSNTPAIRKTARRPNWPHPAVYHHEKNERINISSLYHHLSGKPPSMHLKNNNFILLYTKSCPQRRCTPWGSLVLTLALCQ